ncbi:MAG: YbjQ family protein [Thermodesulfobacteriota bacterium]
MIITTTHAVEGKKITQYLGLVSGSSIIGTSFVRDIFAKVADFAGGRVSTYESELKKARSSAINEMRGEAAKLGANAIVGIDLDFEALGEKGSILMVSATGTAVVIS